MKANGAVTSIIDWCINALNDGTESGHYGAVLGRRTISTHRYREWEPDRSGFPNGDKIEQIRFLLRFAILAPSGHNAQPWRFEIDSRTPSLVVKLEHSRLLHVSDPDDRVTYMALGGAARNFMKAAQSYGLATDMAIVETNGEHQIRITLEDQHATASDDGIDWIDAITRRCSNRSAFFDDEITPERRARITDIDIPEVEVRTCVSPAEKSIIAHLTAQGSRKLINSKEFRRELGECVHPEGADCSTGMPSSNMGFPKIASPFASFIIRHAQVGSLLAGVAMKQLTNAPMVVVLLTKGDTPRQWILAGMAHEELFLRVTAEGLALDTFAAATADGPTRIELAKALGVDRSVQILVRIGKAKNENPSRSPRLPVEAVLNP